MHFSPSEKFYFFQIAALLTVIILYHRGLIKNQLNISSLFVGSSIVVGFAAYYSGAKLGSFIESRENPYIISLGQELFAGIIFLFLFLFIFFKITSSKPYRYLSIMTPYILTGIAIQRLGCVVSGDGDFGVVAPFEIFPLTIIYDCDSPYFFCTAGVPVWNLPFIESFICLLIAGFVGKIGKKEDNFATKATIVYSALLYSATVLVLGFLKYEEYVFLPLFPKPNIEKAFGDRTVEYYKATYWYGLSYLQVYASLIIFFAAAWFLRIQQHKDSA